MKKQMYLTIPITIDMNELSDQADPEVIQERIRRIPVLHGSAPEAAQRQWLMDRWAAQVKLQRALQTSTDHFVQFCKALALQDLSADFAHESDLNQALFPLIEQLGLIEDFFPDGLPHDSALVETTLDILEATKISFGDPSCNFIA